METSVEKTDTCKAEYNSNHFSIGGDGNVSAEVTENEADRKEECRSPHGQEFIKTEPTSDVACAYLRLHHQNYDSADETGDTLKLGHKEWRGRSLESAASAKSAENSSDSCSDAYSETEEDLKVIDPAGAGNVGSRQDTNVTTLEEVSEGSTDLSSVTKLCVGADTVGVQKKTGDTQRHSVELDLGAAERALYSGQHRTAEEMEAVPSHNKHKKRERKPNFTHTEIVTLIGEVAKHKHVILRQEAVGDYNVLRLKRRYWQIVAEKVSKVSQPGVKRTAHDVREKWRHLKAIAVKSRRDKDLTNPNITQTACRDLYSSKVLQIVDSHRNESKSGPAELTLEEQGEILHAEENPQKCKRFRKPNFSQEEIETLIQEVEQRRVVLLQSNMNADAIRLRRQHWQLVTNRINNCAEKTAHRTLAEVRDKWKSLRLLAVDDKKALTKAVENDQPAPTVSKHTVKILQLLNTVGLEMSVNPSSFDTEDRSSFGDSNKTTRSNVELGTFPSDPSLRNTLDTFDDSGDASGNINMNRSSQWRASLLPPDPGAVDARGGISQRDRSLERGRAEKRCRRANMTDEQIDCLLKGVEEYQSLLLVDYPDNMFSQEKHIAWNTITERVNRCNGIQWELSDVKQSWKHRKTNVKKYMDACSRGENSRTSTPWYYGRVMKLLQNLKQTDHPDDAESVEASLDSSSFRERLSSERNSDEAARSLSHLIAASVLAETDEFSDNVQSEHGRNTTRRSRPSAVAPSEQETLTSDILRQECAGPESDVQKVPSVFQTSQRWLSKIAGDQTSLIKHHLRIMTRSCQELRALGVESRVLLLNSGYILSRESDVERGLEKLQSVVPEPPLRDDHIGQTSSQPWRSSKHEGKSAPADQVPASPSSWDDSGEENTSVSAQSDGAFMYLVPHEDGIRTTRESAKRSSHLSSTEEEPSKGDDHKTASQPGVAVPPFDNPLSETPLQAAVSASCGNDQAGKFCCEVCGKLFTEKRFLTKHRARHRAMKLLSCDVCGQCYSSKHRFRMHMERHRGVLQTGFICDVCGQGFTEKCNLKSHMRIHTGEKPFSCEYCGKSFSVAGPLKFHLATHTGYRPHRCEICGKGFVQPARLRYHMQSHSAEKPFKCQDCEKAYSNKYQLKIHKRLHSNENANKCSVCGKFMQTPYKLSIHMRLHTGEKPYSCDICGEKFSRSDVLFQHKKKHGTQNS